MKQYILFFISVFFTLGVFSSYAENNEPEAPVNAPAEAGLKDYAKNFLVGARPDPTFTYNGSDRNAQILRAEFNAIQPTCYPFRAWTGAYAYSFATFSNWVNWGTSNKQKVLMHMIAGPSSYFPGWIKDPAVPWDVNEFDRMLEEYVKKMMTTNDNYKKVYAWNVVNEVFDYQSRINGSNGSYHPDDISFLHFMGWEDDMSGLTGSDKVNSRHPVYISKAFEYAAKYAGDGLLEIREINFEFNPTGRKAMSLYQLVLHLRAKGLRVDALGLQCHLFNNNSDSYNYNNFIALCNKFKSIGLKLFVTELDIANFNNLAVQKQRYKEFIAACERAKVDQVYFWGVADGKDPNWRTKAEPLLFDTLYNKKPAYQGVLEALQEAAPNAISSVNANPALSGMFDIQTNMAYFTVDNGEIVIYDMVGKIVSSRIFESGQADLSFLQPGIYSIRMRAAGKAGAMRFVKR